jgi:ATP-dependent exoDNAse (exonuclease V) beta subunit
VESGVIDVLYETANGWVVADFKTDDIRDEEALIDMLAQEGYVAQVRRYQSAAERLLGVRPRAGLCLLNYAGTVRWVDCE